MFKREKICQKTVENALIFFLIVFKIKKIAWDILKFFQKLINRVFVY